MKGTDSLLGGYDPAAFLARFWQKRALLVRDAMPGFADIVTPQQLMALAERDDVESRLIVRERGRWSLAHGPFRKSDFRRLPPRHWTLLVQDVNLVDAAADALLRRFAFIPFARLDDLMVSYATPGGGVGPHFDSYDVFLLQGSGRRRWRYGRQRDLSLVPNLPLKILRRFTPRQSHVLAPGDMLYLPPQYAHDGVAVDACMTYSIGFRALSNQQIAEAFLDFLRDDVTLAGRYTDPDLRATSQPARIGSAMQRRFNATLAQIRWDRARVAHFLGCLLTEPKANARFARPGTPLTPMRFARNIARHGLALDRTTQLLYDDAGFYLNGAVVPTPRAGASALRQLANRRALAARDCVALPRTLVALLYQWYRYGFLASDAPRA
jgi:50S ribosomal protein L16 3-hydroxylase